METIHTFAPEHPLLKSIVDKYVFWRRGEEDHTPVHYLPNSISGFGFTLSGSMYVQSGATERELPAWGTRNLLLGSGELLTKGALLNISVRFKTPAGLCHFTKVPVKNIYEGHAIALEYVFTRQDTEQIATQLLDAPDDKERRDLLESFLLCRLARNYPPVLAEILSFIHNSQGAFNIKYIARQFFVSERSINRYFNTYIGIAPILYINLIRFRSALSLFEGQEKINLSDTLDFGYFDHAHFIKHFKKFSTLTPAQFTKACKSQKLSDFYNL